MSKEIIRPSQFAKARPIAEEEFSFNVDQINEIAALYQDVLSELKPGKLVVGKIVEMNDNGVIVDINYKSQGFIPRYEFSAQELKEFAPGQEIEVILDELENLDGEVGLSYEKAKALKAWDSILKLFEESKPVQGIVTHKVKGGLSVDIGIPAFLPGSQVDLQRVTDFDQYVNQPITANIIKINQKRGNVIISRRKFLNEQRAESRKKILDTLDIGQVIQGTVKNITNYGVFIDIGGVDGLLHITDMTWGRISHPSELVKIGDTISVKVLSFDKDNEKISLGMKQLTENPWEKAAETLKVGEKVKGRISSITDYGLFVEVQKGVEGLVHISEVSWQGRINDLKKHFKVGDEIEALIVSFDSENRRMSLSIKQLEKNPWESIAEQFKPGQKISGKISNITDFGIFVQLLPGIDGLVHISDLSWTEHVAHPSDIYTAGQEVDAVILSVDPEKQKISLGIKQLTENPWENIEKEFPVGSMVEGTVAKIANFGAFVKLPSGIEGLIRNSEIPEDKKLEDLLEVGKTYSFRVLKINKDEQKIALSLKPEGSSETKQKTRPVRKEKAGKARSDVKDSPKMKSLLQLELERHASKTDE